MAMARGGQEEGLSPPKGTEMPADHHVTPMAPRAISNGVQIGGQRWIDGLCGAAWRHFDSLTPVGGPAPSIAEAVETGVKKGLNEGNLRTEFHNWRRYNRLA